MHPPHRTPRTRRHRLQSAQPRAIQADADPLDAIGALAGEDTPTQLAHLICCVDALTLEARLSGVRPAERSLEGAAPAGDPGVLLLARQLEYASVIALANTQQLTPAALARAAALASALSPDARIVAEAPHTANLIHTPNYSVEQDRAGWIQLLNNTCAPLVQHPRVVGMRYEHMRPFHAGRFAEALRNIFEHHLFGTVVRSGGFCRVSSASDTLFLWDHAGAECTLTAMPGTHDSGGAEPPTYGTYSHDGAHEPELLSVGQELAFIGLDLDTAAITTRLSWATLTDTELLAGPAAWASHGDPLLP